MNFDDLRVVAISNIVNCRCKFLDGRNIISDFGSLMGMCRLAYELKLITSDEYFYYTKRVRL